MAYKVMACIVMAYIVMAFIVMADIACLWQVPRAPQETCKNTGCQAALSGFSGTRPYIGIADGVSSGTVAAVWRYSS